MNIKLYTEALKKALVCHRYRADEETALEIT